MLRYTPPSFIALVVAFCSVGCSGVRTSNRVDVPVYSLDRAQAELRANKGALQLPEQGIIVKVDKGTRVPLVVDVSLPFAAVEPGANFVRFEHDLFFFLSRSGFEISPDGRRWARVQDLKGVKRLFGAGRGTFAFGAGINDAGPLVSLTLKVPAPAKQ